MHGSTALRAKLLSCKDGVPADGTDQRKRFAAVDAGLRACNVVGPAGRAGHHAHGGIIVPKGLTGPEGVAPVSDPSFISPNRESSGKAIARMKNGRCTAVLAQQRK